MTLRSRRTELLYWLHRKLKLTRELTEEPTIEDFTYWRLIKNRYPYNARCSKSLMLIPKRVFATLEEATHREREEYNHLMQTLSYDFLLWNPPRRQTKPKHYHVHLLTYKKRIKKVYFSK